MAPERTLARVVFPVPQSPYTSHTLPGSISKLTLSRIFDPLNNTERFSAATAPAS